MKRKSQKHLIGGALMAPYGFVPEYMRFSDEQIKTLSNRIEELCEYAKTKGVALAGCYANVSAKIIQNLQHIHNMYGDTKTDTSGKHITCMGCGGRRRSDPTAIYRYAALPTVPFSAALNKILFRKYGTPRGQTNSENRSNAASI